MCLFTRLSPASATLAISLKNYPVSLQDCWFYQIIIFAGSWWQSRVSLLFWRRTQRLKFPLHQASVLESATCSDGEKKELQHHNFHFDSGAICKWPSKCDCLLPSSIVAAGILPSVPSSFPSWSSFSCSVHIWFLATKAGALPKLTKTPYTLSFAAQRSSFFCESAFMMLFFGVKFRLQYNWKMCHFIHFFL